MENGNECCTASRNCFLEKSNRMNYRVGEVLETILNSSTMSCQNKYERKWQQNSVEKFAEKPFLFSKLKLAVSKPTRGVETVKNEEMRNWCRLIKKEADSSELKIKKSKSLKDNDRLQRIEKFYESEYEKEENKIVDKLRELKLLNKHCLYENNHTTKSINVSKFRKGSVNSPFSELNLIKKKVQKQKFNEFYDYDGAKHKMVEKNFVVPKLKNRLNVNKLIDVSDTKVETIERLVSINLFYKKGRNKNSEANVRKEIYENFYDINVKENNNTFEECVLKCFANVQNVNIKPIY